eukprot:scaffold34584_cov87-Phaeocystis_antarctica.AAC.8
MVALATPRPSARMRGVVTSPVVTPAQSHAMPTAVSEGVCRSGTLIMRECSIPTPWPDAAIESGCGILSP